jgi:hypothetical protein
VFVHAPEQPLAPGVDVVLVAALEQCEETHATEASNQLFGVQCRLEEALHLDEDLFAGGGADHALECRKLVDLHERHAAHAAGGGDCEALGDRLEKLAAAHETRGVVHARGRGHRPLDDARLGTRP